MSTSDVPQSTPTTTAEAFPFGDLPSVLNPKTVLKSEASLRDAGSLPPEMLVAPSTLIGRLFPQFTDASQDPQLLSPTRASGVELDHFTLQERIGLGAMGAVFRAQDNRLDRIVAVKILSPTLARDPSVIQRFRQEAKATAQVDHENVAKVFYIGENQGLHFIVYEFVEGRNIRDILLDRGKLQPEDALNYMLQIAHALSAMWRVKVVHRDIKPSNILITPAGRAKLVDLGLARIKNPDSTATDLTEIGTTLGTFDYISPEQAKDPRNVDVRSDIYSLGCTLYHMLTGSPPYPEGTLFQKLLNHQKQKPPNPAKSNPRVSKDFVALTQRMMSANPSRRPVNAEILIQELAGIARSYGLQAVHPGSVVWVQPEPLRENFWTKHFGIIASVCILGAIIVGVDRFGDEVQPRVFTQSIPQGLPLPTEEPEPPSVATGPEMQSPTISAEIQPWPLIEEHAEGLAHPGLSPFDRQIEDSPTLALFQALPSFNVIPPDSILVNPPVDVLPMPGKTPEPVKPANPPVNSPAQEPPVAPVVASAWEITLLKPDNSRTNFPTLEAACAAAADGSVILLKYNGRRLGAGSKPLLEKPLRINNKSLTIRGADGYRPAVEFGPRPLPQDQVQTRMIELNNSSLTLINLDLSVETGEQFSTDQWALISARQASQILLERTTVTFLNPTGQPATALEILPDPRSSDMKMMGNPPLDFDPQPTLILRHCVVRGNCNLVSLYDSRSRSIQVEQSILALDQNLLYQPGDVDSEPKADASLELVLNHVTAALGGSLIRMDSGQQPPARDLIPLEVLAQNSIFTPAGPGQPLVRMEGGTNVQDFRRLLHQWTGIDNFVDYRLYWVIETPDGTSPAPFLEEDWRRFWLTVSGSNLSPSRSGEVRWATAWTRKPLTALQPADLELDASEAAANPALTSSRDGSNAGADLKAVPVPPDFSQPVTRSAEPAP